MSPTLQSLVASPWQYRYVSIFDQQGSREPHHEIRTQDGELVIRVKGWEDGDLIRKIVDEHNQLYWITHPSIPFPGPEST